MDNDPSAFQKASTTCRSILKARFKSGVAVAVGLGVGVGLGAGVRVGVLMGGGVGVGVGAADEVQDAISKDPIARTKIRFLMTDPPSLSW